jgi:hypothetical protein
MLIFSDVQPACWPASDTARKLASKLAGMQERRLASQRDGWADSKQAVKKAVLPSGCSAGRLTKDPHRKSPI